MTLVWRRRLVALGALVGAVVVAVVVLGSDPGHVLHVRFMDAGQLVTGDAVSIAGRPVGSVEAIDLATDGTADVVTRIDDDAWPLHLGLQAQIRLTSLAGLANRYVALLPGRPGAPPLDDGATLDLTSTQGVVDLDQVLDSFGPKVRRDLQGFLRGGAEATRDAGRAGNQVLRYLPATLTAADRFTAQLTYDPAALSELLRSGAASVNELALHQASITRGVTATQRWFAAAASRRDEITDTLRLAPPVIGRLEQTLRHVRTSLHNPIRPALRALAPAAPRLAQVIRQLPRTATGAVPTLRTIADLLPDTERTLAGLPRVARAGVPAIRASVTALSAVEPIFSALRQYGPEIVIGQFAGVGAVSGYYDANGHYARVPVQTSSIGLPLTAQITDAALGPILYSSGVDRLRTHMLAPCPGGAQNAADDKSNPFAQDAKLCDARDNLP